MAQTSKRLQRRIDQFGIVRYLFRGKSFIAAKVVGVKIQDRWHKARRRETPNIHSAYTRSYDLQVLVKVYDRDIWVDAHHFGTLVEAISLRDPTKIEPSILS